MARYDSPKQRFWSKVAKGDGCWLWTGAIFTHFGYGRFNTRSTSLAAHRYSYELAHGSIPDGMLVCHHCDTPRCVRPDHLFLGTSKDNKHDCVAKGRHASGERHPQAILTSTDAAEIRRLFSDGRTGRGRGQHGTFTQRELASRFGVKRATIANIVDNRAWVATA